ncbi:MAG TPA: glycosyltransferase [Mesotoga infera]|uniref:Glycosyltransferase n=1 Tax=Mesotoga infera TaxID=1236046 RepID=A0A7C1CX63_9BACT|nr:glycosyltransferase [Mesotoga infera]
MGKQKQMTRDTKVPLSTPLVSVIIPAYNAESTIIRTVRSILLQNYENIEVIVVDDGSTDNTANELKSISGDNQRVRLVTQNNQGVSVARNRGIQDARGEYIVFLDSDDFLEPEFVSVLVSIISSTDSDIAFCSYRWVDERGKSMRLVVPKNDEGLVKEGESVLLSIFEGSMSIWTGSAIYRKAFLSKNHLQFVPGAKNGQDREFIWKAVLKAKRIVGTERILSNYVIRNNSLVKNKDISKAHTLGCIRRIGKYLRSNTRNERILSIFEKRIVPRDYTALVYFFAIRGFDKRKLLEIARNSGYRSQLKRIRLRYAKLSEYLATRALLLAPRATILLFRVVGRRLRKDLLD